MVSRPPSSSFLSLSLSLPFKVGRIVKITHPFVKLSMGKAEEMKIKKLHIENYKSLKTGDVELSKDVNLFVGKKAMNGEAIEEADRCTI